MHILHLEDDAPLLEIFRIALGCSNTPVKLVQFADSDQAVNYLTKHLHEIDLYILDIRVPGGRNGLEVAEYIRNLDKHTSIVITSAYRPPSADILKGLDCEWMAKPWHILTVVDMLIPLANKKIAMAGV